MGILSTLAAAKQKYFKEKERPKNGSFRIEESYSCFVIQVYYRYYGWIDWSTEMFKTFEDAKKCLEEHKKLEEFEPKYYYL